MDTNTVSLLIQLTLFNVDVAATKQKVAVDGDTWMFENGEVPFQVYELAPEAIKVIVPPRQVDVGLLVAKVGWKTFTVTILVLLQVVTVFVAVTE